MLKQTSQFNIQFWWSSGKSLVTAAWILIETVSWLSSSREDPLGDFHLLWELCTTPIARKNLHAGNFNWAQLPAFQHCCMEEMGNSCEFF